ncbi:enoyl-CoA hydratase/isomerase family protein [Dethiosulfatarculus sandiegensis]|uniref:Enoyl-CoA hydratase n=1 Tax=Dethiosulfatarculus sandiegensis TaxID=1429043 RepID=A0A0D2JP43_9BACT|nr:enoyl-CoA hydratase/isomerase family protein [Dethiosulfatarculus sandiegensis]KIX11260.1 hypothetical protein X474_26090 [Dethiosulfatarculus sandiegensis]
MNTIKLDAQGDLALLKLQHGVTNAINPEMAQELTQAAQEIKRNFRGMVFSGGEKFFSMGFDLPFLLKITQEEMLAFLNTLSDAILDLYTLPLPTVTAIKGHAVAGGQILALVSDWRIAGSKRILMGLNEVKLGVPVPFQADLILRQLLGDRQATEMLFTGEFVSTDKALLTGLVDQIVPDHEVDQAAFERVSKVAAMPQDGFKEIKANRVEMVADLCRKYQNEKNTRFVELWFSAETQAILQKAAEKF